MCDKSQHSVCHFKGLQKSETACQLLNGHHHVSLRARSFLHLREMRYKEKCFSDWGVYIQACIQS